MPQWELYKPRNSWLNDPRVLVVNGELHAFYLQMRGGSEVYGLATSKDGLSWVDQGVVLSTGANGEWDDAHIWTGEVLVEGGRFYMLYTGISKADLPHYNQSTGLAWSDDGRHWVKHPNNPVIVADSRWYESDHENSPGYGHVAWRDPSLIKDPDTGRYLAFITARKNEGPGALRGVIALAESSDLVHWEVLPPVFQPNLEAYHEVPQVLRWEEQFLMLFGSKRNENAIYAISSKQLRFWDPQAPATKLLGGDGVGFEYSGWIYPSLQAEGGYEFLHLTYEWFPQGGKLVKQRGRLSAPKQFVMVDSVPKLILREDLNPLTQPRPLALGNDPVPAGALGVTFRNKPGNLTIKVADGNGLSTAAFDLALQENTLRVKYQDPRYPERSWPVTRQEEESIVLLLAGKHVEVYWCGEYLGTVGTVEAACSWLVSVSPNVGVEAYWKPVQAEHQPGPPL